MNVRYISVLFFFLVSFISCAQPKYGIRSTNAFFHQYLPGTIRMDEKGNPVEIHPDTIIVVYLETIDSSIKWETAFRNGQSYSIQTLSIKEKLVDAGLDKSNNTAIILKPEVGNFFWQLQFIKNEIPSKQTGASKPGQIILEGHKRGKKIIFAINKITEISMPPSV